MLLKTSQGSNEQKFKKTSFVFYIKEAFVDRDFQYTSALDFQEIQLIPNSHFLDTYINGNCGLQEKVLSNFPTQLRNLALCI